MASWGFPIGDLEGVAFGKLFRKIRFKLEHDDLCLVVQRESKKDGGSQLNYLLSYQLPRCFFCNLLFAVFFCVCMSFVRLRLIHH